MKLDVHSCAYDSGPRLRSANSAFSGCFQIDGGAGRVERRSDRDYSAILDHLPSTLEAERDARTSNDDSRLAYVDDIFSSYELSQLRMIRLCRSAASEGRCQLHTHVT